MLKTSGLICVWFVAIPSTYGTIIIYVVYKRNVVAYFCYLVDPPRVEYTTGSICLGGQASFILVISELLLQSDSCRNWERPEI